MEKIEIWKRCAEYPKYEVSDLGRIRHIAGNIRKTRQCAGYQYVCIWQNGKHKNLRVHRLVAKAFIPNPSGKRCVNHIDGNRSNNRVDNLEWCSASENEIHKSRVLMHKASPPVITKAVLCVETGILYTSIQAAAENTKVNHRHIGEVASGKRKTAGGYHWTYAEGGW